jgi:RimJ/RimL family protein N-acetyltransferase
MTIRLLEPEDAQIFQAVRLRGLLEEPTAFVSDHSEEVDRPLSDVAARLIPKEGAAVFGAFIDGELAGVTGVETEKSARLRHKAWVWGVFVQPEFRGQGLARALIAASIEHAFTWPGVLQLNLGVNATNAAARRLYESLGFVEFSFEKQFMIVNGEPHDEILMVKVR